MKGLLTEFANSGINAAAVWFARPDGSYYSVEKGLTGQNLRDRTYFPRLMAGNDVVGDLVISKSTGERSAILAAPVLKGGKIIGALGVSLSVTKMSRMLQEKMDMPENIVFYALDPKGRISLHKQSDLLFVFPSDLGSKSLNKAVSEMLSKKEGTVSYEFRGKKVVDFRKSGLTGWVYAIGVVY
jgi:C4-dicarboxylate-specific signal transduction histidine kinase